MGAVHEILSSCLLFLLVFGMSATVDIKNLRTQLRNRKAILTGIFLQFIILPFFGFVTVQALGLDTPLAITLLVITSSPGGSYSNWWCSMFNADLALSVTMTAISTMVSTVMLPVNLIIYTQNIGEGNVVDAIDWVSLFVALAVVIASIGLGLFSSAYVHSPKFNLYANKLGNLAGLSLVIISIFVSNSSKTNEKIWNHDWKFYLGVASPCVLGLVTANIFTTYMDLRKPERVTASVECTYQNIGIATSVAFNMFEGEELAEAVAVPLYYGLVEAITLGIYCIGAWKAGWTKAPSNESFCKVIANSYEVEKAQLLDVHAVEVVLGSQKEGVPSDLVFEIDRNHPIALPEAEEGSAEGPSIYGISYPSPPRPPAKVFEKSKEQTEPVAETINDKSGQSRKFTFPISSFAETDFQQLNDIEMTASKSIHNQSTEGSSSSSSSPTSRISNSIPNKAIVANRPSRQQNNTYSTRLLREPLSPDTTSDENTLTPPSDTAPPNGHSNNNIEHRSSFVKEPTIPTIV